VKSPPPYLRAQVDSELLAIYDADHHPDPESLLVATAYMRKHDVDCVQVRQLYELHPIRYSIHDDRRYRHADHTPPRHQERELDSMMSHTFYYA